MPNYIRNRVNGGCYFFTVNLLERHQNELLTEQIDLLRDVVKRVKNQHPFHIDGWVSALLTLLIEDATHRSVLRVSIQNPDKNTLCISLANSGGGLPQEQLEHTLASHKSYLDITDDPITQVSVLANQVPVWGGEVSLQSSIGKGYAVEITLQTFNLSLPSSANEA